MSKANATSLTKAHIGLSRVVGMKERLRRKQGWSHDPKEMSKNKWYGGKKKIVKKVNINREDIMNEEEDVNCEEESYSAEQSNGGDVEIDTAGLDVAGIEDIIEIDCDSDRNFEMEPGSYTINPSSRSASITVISRVPPEAIK